MESVFKQDKPRWDGKTYYQCFTCHEGLICSDCQYEGKVVECPICKTNWDVIMLKHYICMEIDTLICKNEFEITTELDELKPELYIIIYNNSHEGNIRKME